MELVREVFRLKWEGKQSNRRIGRSLHISKSTVTTYLARASRCNITTYEQIKTLSDGKLKRVIFPDKFSDKQCEVDFAKINAELRRKNMTLMLLWQEELESNPALFNYSRFCDLYSKWNKTNKITMRQSYKAGERGFIDYAGTTVPITNNETGELHPAQIFVMSLSGTHYTYIEATWTQGARDFLSSHVRAFEFFGGGSRNPYPR